jgi:hypothetical protein
MERATYMNIYQVVSLILITFITSYYWGYKEGREDGTAASLRWRKAQEKANR